MLKLKNFVTQYGALIPTALLILLLAGCGSGGGSDNILCGGDPCPTVGDDTDDSTDDIDNIVDQGVPDSIEFVSVTPTTVSIQGAGGDETGIVTFIVTDTAGDPLADVTVSFVLSNTVGGASLANASDTTNANGEASTIVQAGTVQTTVRVTASVDGTTATTLSDPIPVSTGVTDSNGFSLAFDILNPEGLNFNGVEVEVSVILNDFYGNPPPDGTSVAFYAEAGTIEPSCSTVGGRCSVTWISSNPRPGDPGTFGNPDGVAQILAYTTGAESFVDTNSNGKFDSGEVFVDLSEVYADEMENGVYDVGEFFIDFDYDGSGVTHPNSSYDGPDNEYNGPLCNGNCALTNTITIGASNTLIISGSSAVLANNGGLGNGGTLNVAGGDIIASGVQLTDVNDNILPFGTSITVETTNGTVEGTTSFDTPNGQFAPSFSFVLSGDDESSTGLLTITTTTPLGVVSQFTWVVTD